MFFCRCLVNEFLSLSFTSRRKIEQPILCIWLKGTLSLPFSETKLARELVRCSAKDTRQSWVRISIQGLWFTRREPIYLTNLIFLLKFSLLCFLLLILFLQRLSKFISLLPAKRLWNLSMIWRFCWLPLTGEGKSFNFKNIWQKKKGQDSVTSGHVCDL